MRTAGLGKTSELWRQEVKEEQSKANQWEEKFRDAQAREGALKRSLVESQNEKEGLKIRVSELERSLYQYRSRNSAIELKASQNRIEELKENIEELKTALQNRDLQIELLEVNNERWKEQLHQSQDQVRSRDYVMGEALTQVQEVADHLQTLAVQADVLSLKYESKSDRGRELAWLLRQKNKSNRSKVREIETNAKRDAGSITNTYARTACQNPAKYEGPDAGVLEKHDGPTNAFIGWRVGKREKPLDQCGR
ncbi:tropomyosin-1-like [Gossypium hirsutum]|uniref:Tropomyosin-1-like n=1 Tax=Gossypium hirsutum TaxID=3635 RepID=A0A1U8KIF6_GOSHI|nr:tropomyosin-1-like [Gossypium hirsutum]